MAGQVLQKCLQRCRWVRSSLTHDADKFWEITAAVVPVLALAFILEVRSAPLQRLMPFDRFYLSLTHALTIILLLVAQMASLLHLLGSRQAPWAEYVAFYGMIVSLSVILVTPASRLITVGLHSSGPSDYVFYWKKSRVIRKLRRELRQIERQLLVAKRQMKKFDAVAAEWQAQNPFVPVVDLQSAWRNAEIASGNEDLQRTRAKFSQDITAHRERINKANRKLRKRKKQLIRHTGGYRAQLIMKVLDKHTGANH